MRSQWCIQAQGFVGDPGRYSRSHSVLHVRPIQDIFSHKIAGKFGFSAGADNLRGTAAGTAAKRPYRHAARDQ